MLPNNYKEFAIDLMNPSNYECENCQINYNQLTLDMRNHSSNVCENRQITFKS